MFKKFSFILILFLFFSCTKKNSDNSIKIDSEINNIDEIDYGFYSPSLDNGEWVDQLLANMEEERIAEELESLSELESLIKAPYSSEKDKVEPVEIRLTDSYNRLKFLEFGEEYFIPDFSNGKFVFVNKYKEKVSRIFYDELYRVIKKEYWKIEDIESAEKILTEEYKYYQQEFNPQSKKITSDQNILYTEYNSKGLPVYLENKIYSEKKKMYVLEYIKQLEYDSEKRITLEETKNYSNNSEYITKETYSYNQEDVSPDYAYYENGELKIKTTYLSKTEYNTQVFFDSSNSVITYYKDGNKIKDMYYSDDVLVREKEYEQQ